MTDAFYDSSVLVLPLRSTALNAKRTQDFSRIAALATLSGDAEISNGRCNFGGTGYITLPASSYYAIGTGDCTIESRFCVIADSVISAGGGRQACILSIDNGTSASLEVNIGGTSAVTGDGFWSYSAGVGMLAWQGATVTHGVEHHFAMVRKNGWIHYFFDGAELGSGVQQAASIGGLQDIHIGGRPWTSNQYGLVGYIKDVRIDTFARYTGPFTPPATLDNPEWEIGGSALCSTLKGLSAYEDVQPAASRIAGVRTVVPDYFDGGDGKIVGLVDKIGGAPVSCRVVLHRLRDGRPIRETWSNAAGVYAFTHLDRSELYCPIAFSPDGKNRAMAADGLTAEPM